MLRIFDSLEVGQDSVSKESGLAGYMENLRVKICGITKPAQGRAIALAGASDLGFICVESSPRYVTTEQIQLIVNDLPCTSNGSVMVGRIGVFVNATLEQIGKTVEVGGLSGVQLHGNEPPEFCQQVRDRLPQIEIIKALRVRDAAALAEAHTYTSVVNTLLLDAYHPQLAGGTGKTLDWQLLQAFQPACPWFLAGGLTPANILQALQIAVPQGIDLSSGVEQAPGDKDLTKVRTLFDLLRRENWIRERVGDGWVSS